MSLRHHRLAPAAALSGALSLALVLTGCQKAAENADSASTATAPALPATLPMTNAPVQQTALAPSPNALPRVQPIRTVRVADPRSAYAYADQAGYFSQSLGDAPPDYGFSYGDVRPWAWQGYDGSRSFVEPVPGGYRTYYYRAGADRPYFVRDPDYAYGYDGDRLAAVYGPDGALIPYDNYGPQQAYAAAYLWRARRLYEASSERQAVSAAAWMARQNAIIAMREQWAANRDRQADWAAYHAQEAAQESQYWALEAQRREADQQRFAQWRQQDFRTPPPPRAIPQHWQQASWAQDSARYVPVAAAVVAGGAAAALLTRHHQDAAAQHPPSPARPMPPQPFTRPAGPTPAQPILRPQWQGQPGQTAHAPRQEPMARPAAPHWQAAAANHHPDASRQPEAMPHQRPAGPPPEVHVHTAAFRQDPHDRPAMKPPERRVIIHSGSPRNPQEPSAMAHVPIHGGAPSAPMVHPARPPEAHPAPAMTPHREPAPPRHENSGQPKEGHPGTGNHHDHH